MSGTRLQVPVSTSLHNAKSAEVPHRRPADVANFSAPRHSLSQIKLQGSSKPQGEITQIPPVQQEADFGAENFQSQKKDDHGLTLPVQTQANTETDQDHLELADEILANNQSTQGTVSTAQGQEAKQSAQKSLNNQPTTIKGTVPPGTLLKQEATANPPLTPTGAQSATPQLTMPSLTAPRQAPLFSSQREEFTISAFQTNSAALQAPHTETIQAIAANLAQNPLNSGDYITVWGHTDSSGPEAHNQELGQQRADAARQYLLSLLNDPEAGNEIRAYSAGESLAERQGSVPEYRKVTITITRRQINPGRMPVAAPQLRPPAISTSVRRPNLFPPNILNPALATGPTRPQLPPWFWRTTTPVGGPTVDLRQLSEVLTDGLRQDLSSGIAPLLEPLAHIVGARSSRSEIERSLNDAFISAGETGLKELLQMMIFNIAGQPSSRPENPYGPVMPDGLPSPIILNSPVFTF